MKFPLVTRKRLRQAEVERDKLKSEVDSLRWWMKQKKIEPPSAQEILFQMALDLEYRNPRRTIMLTGIQ